MRTQIKRRWQETFDVEGHKITVVIKMRTSLGNFIGYAADVYDNRGNKLNIPMINKLYAEEAQEIAYVRFVKEFC